MQRVVGAPALRTGLSLARRPAFVGQTRGFINVGDRITNFAQDRKARKERELFEKQMDRLYQSEHYTLAEHMKTFNEAQDQGQGWRGMMPGVKSSPEFATIKRGIAVFEAMTPEEVNSTGELLGRREKLRLAESAGCTVEDVNELLKQYELLQQIHRWIKVRKSKGLAPPRSSEELQAQMASDRDGLSAKFAAQSMPGTPSKYRRAGKKRRY